MGPEIPLNRALMAAGMAGSHPVLCLPTSGAQNHLHHQRHRKPEPRHPLNYQNTRELSNGRGRDKADLPRHPQLRESRAVRQRMGCRTKPVRYPIPRTVQQMTRQNRMGCASYTEFRILPVDMAFGMLATGLQFQRPAPLAI